MWKKLCLAEVCPMTAWEKQLFKERNKFLAENHSRLGTIRIVFKKKKVIDRES